MGHNIIYELNNGNGKIKGYFPNGKLKMEGDYLYGENYYKGKEYDIDGEIIFIGEYKNGERWKGKGKEYVYDILRFEGEYIYSQKIKGKEYYISGNLRYEGEFYFDYTREIATDHAQGSFMTTGNQLDLAISGEGFFVIDTPEGLRYTRNGNFYRAVNGDLVNSDGRAVLSAQGRPINIPENAVDITVTAEGGIYAGGALLVGVRFFSKIVRLFA